MSVAVKCYKGKTYTYCFSLDLRPEPGPLLSSVLKRTGCCEINLEEERAFLERDETNVSFRQLLICPAKVHPCLRVTLTLPSLILQCARPITKQVLLCTKGLCYNLAPFLLVVFCSLSSCSGLRFAKSKNSTTCFVISGSVTIRSCPSSTWINRRLGL